MISEETLRAIVATGNDGEMQEYTLKFWGRGEGAVAYAELAIKNGKEMAQELLKIRELRARVDKLLSDVDAKGIVDDDNEHWESRRDRRRFEADAIADADLPPGAVEMQRAWMAEKKEWTDE
jgi:hypothetical protein